MINARAQAFEALNDNSDNIEGILEIQTSSIPGVTFLPDLLAGFRKDRPGIQYYVSVSDTQTVLENIMERRGEIGFIGEKTVSSSIECTRVAVDKSVLISPVSYDMPKKIKLADATAYPFIWRETGSATRRAFEQAALKAGYEKEEFEVAALVDDMDAIIRSVEAGLGVAIISERVASTLGSRVNVVELEDYNEDREFYMVSLKSASFSPAAAAFSEYVKSLVQSK
jgi:DNA-binding transcriptional LysR family regulator